jgi:hypothetical protein
MVKGKAAYGRITKLFQIYSEGLLHSTAILTFIPDVANLSHLCSRVEIYPSPGSKIRDSDINEIAEYFLRVSGKSVLAVLISTREYPLESSAFAWKEYNSFTWKADGDAGFSNTAHALAACYSRIRARANNRLQPTAQSAARSAPGTLGSG